MRFDGYGVVDLRVRASNGRFAGEVDLYSPPKGLARLAEVFCGFPRSSKDSRVAEMGEFDPKYAGGGARFVLRCWDSLGHVVMDVYLRSSADNRFARSETAELAVPVEPAAIDEFVNRVKSMPIEVGSVAKIRQAS